MKINLHSFSAKIVFAFFLVPVFSKAQVSTRISIANGNWNNPAIWSPAGVPTPGDDSIIINTDVTYSQNIYDGLSMFRVNAGASLTDLGNDTAAFGGDRLVVNGYFSTNDLAVGMNDSATIKGIMNVATDVQQAGLFIVQSGGQMCVGQTFGMSDNFVNNGSVRINNWINDAVVTGNGGKFCIANYFINNDAISGNIDICDATPNSFGDVNMGTIAGSVTNCAVGPCGMCPAPTGIAEEFLRGDPLKVYPNPFSTSTVIEVNPALLNKGMDVVFTLYDGTGKEVRTETISSAQINFERNELPAGIYFYRVVLNGMNAAGGKIIIAD